MPASIFNGSAVKILKSILRFKDGTDLASTNAGHLANTREDVQEQIDKREVQNFYPNGLAKANADLSGFSTGNSATFDGGGTIAGTFSLSTAPDDLINDTQVFKLLSTVTAGDNTDDYVASESISIPIGYRGRQLGIKFQYKWEGSSGNIAWRVKDTTNAVILTDDSVTLDAFFDLTNDIAKEFTMSFYCPSDCAAIEIGPHVLTGEASKRLMWDSVVVTADPFVYKDLIETQEYRITQAYAGFTDVTTEVEFALGSATISNSGAGIITATDDSGNTRTKFIANRKCTVNITWQSKLALADSYSIIYKNGSSWATSNDTTGTSRWEHVAAPMDLEAGEYFTVGFDSGKLMSNIGTGTMSFVAIAETENVVHHSAGTENTFSARITSADVITSQSSPNAPAIASVASTSTGLYVITYTSGFFGVIPSVQATAETNGLNCHITDEATSGCTVNIEDTSGTLTDSDFSIFIQRQGTDYKNPNAYAVTPVEQVCYIKDVKSNTTAGGTFTQGAWQTRVLNTVSGDTGFVSLSSNQFTLGAGLYEIEAEAPAYIVGEHKARLQNITDISTEIVGANAKISTGTSSLSVSRIIGRIQITTSKTFEIQHYCTSTQATDGFGIASSYGVDEVYSQVKIRKLK